MGYISHKLKNPLQGALAGGGDPASSPLYVFGPFLKLLVAAGLTKITFGASIWLVIFTVVFVSLMYRSVMKWITDGSGGSGLSEEEFGGWAVKITAGITFVEYTLTFLVSMAALVTFAADRFPALNDTDFLFQNRAWLAIAVSFFTAWLVNRGPATAAKAFGPATAGVLILLWVMMIVVIVKEGFNIPGFDFAAFSGENIGTTFGGYARILALMTGVEVFANMVAAYDGEPHQRAKKAFNSLMIIMVTTALTMLIVGPSILKNADPNNEEKSVFTQTMDALLPPWLSNVGTFIGIAVLLSASASSALGLQNLFVGLKLRRYVPSTLGRINRFGVAGRPVWIEAIIASVAYLIFGTNEETYLALYAAGVFILLSMTGWAATKRLVKLNKTEPSFHHAYVLIGTIFAALLTTIATVIIFYERFSDGAWTYFVFIPALYAVFTLFRRLLGDPTIAEVQTAAQVEASFLQSADSTLWDIESRHAVNDIVIPVDDSEASKNGLIMAQAIAQSIVADLHKIHIRSQHDKSHDDSDHIDDSEVEVLIPEGKDSVAKTICDYADTKSTDLIIMGTRALQGRKSLTSRSVTAEVIQASDCPILVIPSNWKVPEKITRPQHMLVALDGSKPSERALSFAVNIAKNFGTSITLLHVPLNPSEIKTMTAYLTRIQRFLTSQGINSDVLVEGNEPTTSIPEIASDLGVDLLFMTTRGLSGFTKTLIGSITDKVIRSIDIPTVVVPMIED